MSYSFIDYITGTVPESENPFLWADIHSPYTEAMNGDHITLVDNWLADSGSLGLVIKAGWRVKFSVKTDNWGALDFASDVLPVGDIAGSDFMASMGIEHTSTGFGGSSILQFWMAKMDRFWISVDGDEPVPSIINGLTGLEDSTQFWWNVYDSNGTGTLYSIGFNELDDGTSIQILDIERVPEEEGLGAFIDITGGDLTPSYSFWYIMTDTNNNNYSQSNYTIVLAVDEPSEDRLLLVNGVEKARFSKGTNSDIIQTAADNLWSERPSPAPSSDYVPPTNPKPITEKPDSNPIWLLLGITVAMGLVMYLLVRGE